MGYGIEVYYESDSIDFYKKVSCVSAIKSSISNIPEKSDLSKLTPLVIVFTIPLCKVLAPPVSKTLQHLPVATNHRMYYKACLFSCPKAFTDGT